MGVLRYRRHFLLLTCIVAVLAATGTVVVPHGAVASFGWYGLLHAAAVAATFRAALPGWRRGLFVAAGGSSSLLCGTLASAASHHLGGLNSMGRAALLLAGSSACGAAAYALLLRFYGAVLTATAFGVIIIGCTAAPLAVLYARAYGASGGGLWFVVAWWGAFSIGLWWFDGRRGHGVLNAVGRGANMRR